VTLPTNTILCVTNAPVDIYQVCYVPVVQQYIAVSQDLQSGVPSIFLYGEEGTGLITADHDFTTLVFQRSFREAVNENALTVQ
jgi:hypothetical protein